MSAGNHSTNPLPAGRHIMQNSSAFQFLAIDTIHESSTNPSQSFEEAKFDELAESIRQHGLIQPVTVRPDASGFEIVAGARRFRAAQLAELFIVPARIVELNDGQALEWQLVENSQRVDVHPNEEAGASNGCSICPATMWPHSRRGRARARPTSMPD